MLHQNTICLFALEPPKITRFLSVDTLNPGALRSGFSSRNPQSSFHKPQISCLFFFALCVTQIYLGVLLHSSHVSSAAVKFDDQTAEASQASNKAVAQQRLDLLGHLFHHDHHDHHEHHHVQLQHVHDPGYWKKKVVWKSAWKKIW